MPCFEKIAYSRLIFLIRILVCLPAIGMLFACKQAAPFQDKASPPVKKNFGYAWWLDDHKKHREAAALITELLDHLPKTARKDSALKYLTLYLLALPQQQSDSVARTIEALLDPSSPSYSNDLTLFYTGKIRWLIWTRRLAEGRKLLDRCDSLIRHTPATALDSLSLITFWENKARVLSMVNANDSAKWFTEKCLRYYSENKSLYRERIYSAYAMRGIINKALLQVTASLRDFDSARYYLQLSGRDGGVSSGILLMSKGNAWMNIGEFDKANDTYAKAQSIFEGLHDTLEIGILSHNIGLTYFTQYDYEKALKYAKQAEKYMLQVLPPGDGQMLLIEQQLANISDELGDTLAAARYMDHMMTITRTVFQPGDVDYLLSEGKLADHLARTGKADAGIQLYRTLLGKMKISEPVPGQFTDDICYDLAATCYRNGHYAEAFTYFSKSASLESKIYGPHNIYTLYTKELAASCLMDQHLFRQAANLLYPVRQTLHELQSQGVLGTHANNFYKWQIPSSLLKCRYQLAIDNKDTLVILLHEFEDIEIFADNYLKQLAGTVDKGTQKDYDDYYSLGIEICHALYQKTRSPEYLEKAFRYSEKKKEMPLRLALKEQIAKHFAGIPDSLVKKEQDLSAKLAFMEKKYASAMGDHDSLRAVLYEGVLSDANQEMDKLILQLENNYPNYYSLKYDLTVAGVQECRNYLGRAGGAYLQYIVAGDSVYLIAISGKEMVFLELGSRKKIDSLASGFGTALRNNDLPRFKEYSYGLYKLLIGPVRTWLPTEKRWVIAAEGRMQNFPWEALISSDTGRSYEQQPYLLRDYLISYSSGITGQRDQETIHEFDGKITGRFFSFAPGFTDPVKQSTFEITHDSSYIHLIRQPWALEEAAAAANLFSGVSYTGMQATSDAYYNQTQHAGILHFGTHALWNDQNPMLSRLYLVAGKEDPGGGLFTYDIFAHRTAAKLAVLAACQTGVSGEDPGLGRISLAKAFSFAGCPNQVMTLWDVDDEATASLIKEFYIQLKEGLPAAEALQKAKQLLLQKNKDRDWGNPYYWSGIVYYGKDLRIDPSFSASGPAGWKNLPGAGWVTLLLLASPLLASMISLLMPAHQSAKKSFHF